MERTDCPECGATMLLSGGEWRCQRCNLTIPEDEFIAVSEYGDDMPEGCAACGGDYPNCIESCPLMES